MSESVQVSQELDYKKVLSSHPTYTMNRVLPLTGSQQTFLTAAGGNETLFELPASVFNLHQSRFDFYMQVILNNAANAFGWIYKDVVTPIRQIQLYTRAGLYLCDIPYFNNYTKVTMKPSIKLQEYQNNDVSTYDEQAGAGALFSTSGITLFLNAPINGESHAAAPATAAGPPLIISASTTTQRYDGSNCFLPWREPVYLDNTVAGNDGQIQNPVIGGGVTYECSLLFNRISNCILSQNNDLYFGGEVLILRIVWEATNRVAYSVQVANGATNPLAAAATAFANNSNITGMTLYLAVEKNPAIVTSLMNQVSSTGLSLLVDYIYPYKQNVGASTTQSVSIRYNRGHGRKLKKIIASIFNNTETNQTAYDCSNLTQQVINNAVAPNVVDLTIGSKVSNFYSLLNNNRLQEFNLDCTIGDDYKYLKPYLKDTVIQNWNIYANNWFWMDDFTKLGHCHEKDKNLDDGIPLDVEQKWDIYYTMPAAVAYNHYIYAITQKMLTINTAGITLI